MIVDDIEAHATADELAGWLQDRLNRCERSRVSISQLVIAESPRSRGENREHVQALADCGDTLPPIIVHASTMRLIDGAHRVHAHRLRGESEVEALLYEGDEADLFIVAVQMNTTHGLPLEHPDRVAAARRIISIRPHWSDRTVAGVTGLSDKTVGSIRRRSIAGDPQSNARIGRDGRIRPLDGTTGRLRASEIIASRPGASLREIAREAGVAVSTAHDVRQRLASGQDPLTQRQRAISHHTEEPADVARQLSPSPLAEAEALEAIARADTAMTRLRRDPSMRLTDAGRALLHLLERESRAFTAVTRLTQKTPDHCADAVAAIASSYSLAWQKLARTLTS